MAYRVKWLMLDTVRKSKDAVRARARSDSASRTGKPLDEGRTRLNLVEHYLGLVLVILVEAGLFDVSPPDIKYARCMLMLLFNLDARRSRGKGDGLS